MLRFGKLGVLLLVCGWCSLLPYVLVFLFHVLVLCVFTDCFRFFFFRYFLSIDFARVVSYTGYPDGWAEEQLAEFGGHGTVASVFLPLLFDIKADSILLVIRRLRDPG
jgi:hypothetical protein